jgi:hypothetical protein
MDSPATVYDADYAVFRFRVLIEHNSSYNVFVARCLETGSVATADDSETVEDMIKELLVDEVTFAIEHNNLANLYSRPAPYEVWMKFRSAQREGTPTKPMCRAIRARDREEVPAEIKIARTQ